MLAQTSINWGLWGLIVVAAIFEVAGDLALKYWAEGDDARLFALGLGTYLVSLACFAYALKRAPLAIIVGMWVGVALVLMAIFGWVLFGEALSPRRMIGLGLITVALFLLQS